MTAPDPTSLLSQAEAAIVTRREMLAAGTPGPWRRNPDRWAPPQWQEDMAYLRVEAGEPHPASGLGVRIFHTDGAREGDIEDQRHDADVALTVAAVNVFAAATDHAESVLDRHRPDPEPIELMLHMDEECPTGECEEGDGHLSIVCRGCYPAWDGMQAHAVWPCPDARDALTALGIVVE